MARRTSALATIILGLFVLSGCASLPAPLPVTADTMALQPYILAPGDRISMSVFGEAQLTKDYSVTNEGNVSVPLLGDVSVAGKTVPQMEEEVASQLSSRGYLNSPRVSVEVINYRSFYILGEVAKPGAYPYSAGLSISQAIAIAGGYTYRANTRRVFITRAGDPQEHTLELKAGNIPIRAGDVLRIGERYF